ncbi:unnamed protein product [Effrenium voratum]|uniref:Uncharacterized protein n=1 Tax=Effrenium voratum TaxID=2562239 RepID=A0AA36I8U0_9DINO|nr:unnamed protein product [Effrenium voratum]CAJ1383202.1 unnamed protein product [Effrenium voratum]
MDLPPPPPAGAARPDRAGKPGKLQIAADFNEDVGFEKVEGTESDLLQILQAEVEKRAEVMSPIERTGEVFGWKRAGEMAIEAGDPDGAGDCYARALAFGGVLGTIDGIEPFPAWYPRQEVDKICAEVLVKAAELELMVKRPEAAQKAAAWAARALQLDRANHAAQDVLQKAQAS